MFKKYLELAKKVERPEYFFDPAKSMPEEIMLRFVPPPSLAERNLDEIYKKIEKAVE